MAFAAKYAANFVPSNIPKNNRRSFDFGRFAAFAQDDSSNFGANL